MARILAIKTYSTSQYLVRFPLFLITSLSRAFIDPIKLLTVSTRIEYIVFTALCLNCSKDSFVMFCDTARAFSLLEAIGCTVLCKNNANVFCQN